MQVDIGETSLIGKLLQTEYAGKKVAVIENEIGKINLDAEVLENPSIQITSITRGCICCTLHGDFVQAIELLIKTESPDYILIEPTEVADIRGVLKAIEPIPTVTFCGTSQDFVCSLAPGHSKIRIFSLDEGNDKQDRKKNPSPLSK